MFVQNIVVIREHGYRERVFAFSMKYSKFASGSVNLDNISQETADGINEGIKRNRFKEVDLHFILISSALLQKFDQLFHFT